MAKYRKKPVVIEAYQYEGDFVSSGNWTAPDWVNEAYNNGVLVYKEVGNTPPELYVKTIEGDMKCNYKDYIIKGVRVNCTLVNLIFLKKHMNKLMKDKE